VINKEDISRMKEGCILANAGHFNAEISIPEIEKLTLEKTKLNEHVIQYKLNNFRKIYLIGEGRLVNLVAAEGHPSEVMDMSFANQFLSVLKLSESKGGLKAIVYSIDKSQDQEIAMAKLKTMNIEIDTLTEDQQSYLEGFSEGT
jgi:adenosylhomocysteinase